MAFINTESLQRIPLIYLMTEWADRMCGHKASYNNGDSSEWMNKDRWSVLRDWTLWICKSKKKERKKRNAGFVCPWRNIPNMLHPKKWPFKIPDASTALAAPHTSKPGKWITREQTVFCGTPRLRLSTQRQIGRKQRDGAKNTCKSRTPLWWTGSFFSRGRHLVASL